MKLFDSDPPGPPPPFRPSPLRIAVGIATWIVTGWFVLFVLNGGAAGSETPSVFAWAGLAVYTVVFVRIFVGKERRKRE